ncbi:eCIS core domain-containing protein, partial [Rhodocaloribacter sp.]
MIQREAGDEAAPAPAVVHEAIAEPGQALDEGARSFLEPRFGHDFSRVRIHTGARAAEAARSVNATAFTVGNDVVFGTGQ